MCEMENFDVVFRIFNEYMNKSKQHGKKITKSDVIFLLDSETQFLKCLFYRLSDDCASVFEQRRSLLQFLRRTLAFSKKVKQVEKFVLTLRSLGLLQALEMALLADDPVIILEALDIMEYLAQHWPCLLQQYAVEQASRSDKTELFIVNILVEQLHNDAQYGLGRLNQLSYILSRLLWMASQDFLKHFYDHCIDFLVVPFDVELSWNIEIDQAQLLAAILELLIICVDEHEDMATNWLLKSDLIERVGELFKSRHKFLVLAAIRFTRHLIFQNKPSINNLLISANLFASLVSAFLHTNRGLDSLLDSAMIQLFECINAKKIIPLAIYTMKHFWPNQLDQITYVSTFVTMRDWCWPNLCLDEKIQSLFRKFDFSLGPITHIDEDWAMNELTMI